MGSIMGRLSVKENKNVYQQRREELGLSREHASELMMSVPPERIEKIENEKSLAHPDEILEMSVAYKEPHLCNYYCANDCPIGQKYVPEVKTKVLSQIVLETLASLSSMNKKQDRFIEITADGKIDESEIADFVDIKMELDKISVTVETLRLWTEKMLADGRIDIDLYKRILKEKKTK